MSNFCFAYNRTNNTSELGNTTDGLSIAILPEGVRFSVDHFKQNVYRILIALI